MSIITAAKDRVKPSRMERNVRWQARAVRFGSLAVLAGVVGMTARYGWNSTPGDWGDKVWQMGLNGGIDIAGATFAGLLGTFFALRRYWAGLVVGLGLLLCGLYTYQAVAGFLSSSREGMAQSRERAISLADRYLDWSTKIATKNVEDERSAKGRQAALSLSMEAIGAQVKEQIKMAAAGEMGVGDPAATTFARTFGTTEDVARSRGIVIQALTIMLVQYLLAWAYGYTRQRVEPDVARWSAFNAATTNPQQNGQNLQNLVNLSAKFTIAQARSDIAMLAAAGQLDHMSLRGIDMAKRWGVSQATAGNWLRAFGKEGLIRRDRTGERNTLTIKAARVPTHLNGNGALTGDADAPPH